MWSFIPGSEDQPLLQDGDYIQVEEAASDIEQLTGKLGAVVTDIQSVTQLSANPGGRRALKQSSAL